MEKKINNKELEKVYGGGHYDILASECPFFSLKPDSTNTERSHKNCIYYNSQNCEYYSTTVDYPEERELN